MTRRHVRPYQRLPHKLLHMSGLLPAAAERHSMPDCSAVRNIKEGWSKSEPSHACTDGKLMIAWSAGCSEVGGPNPEALATIAQVVAQMSAAAERSARAKRHKIAKVRSRPRELTNSQSLLRCVGCTALRRTLCLHRPRFRALSAASGGCDVSQVSWHMICHATDGSQAPASKRGTARAAAAVCRC